MQQQTGHTLKAFDEDIDRLRGLISETGSILCTLSSKGTRLAMFLA